LDYVNDDENDAGRGKKPWRYRWPDDVRDDVLARLIELNSQRAAEERRSGQATTGPARPAAAKMQRTGIASVEGLF
jgi:hypothetical protein